MGIDLHNLHFMSWALDLGARFDRTVSLGRQALFLGPEAVERHRRLRGLPPLRMPAPQEGGLAYGEPLLQQWFGAATVDAVDANGYEGATLLHDLNLPWPRGEQYLGSYDLVLDLGCLEHVFDFPTAWRNCVDLCRVGGHLLHALPANNLAGHGFYQFSPELFFNLYRPERGFELRELVFAMKAEPRRWFRVASPLAARRRITLCNGHEVYVLVLARKLRDAGPLPPPQQSDYAQLEWEGQGAASPPPSPWRAPLRALGVIDAARRLRARWCALQGARLALPSADYMALDVDRLLARGGPGLSPGFGTRTTPPAP